MYVCVCVCVCSQNIGSSLKLDLSKIIIFVSHYHMQQLVLVLCQEVDVIIPALEYCILWFI